MQTLKKLDQSFFIRPTVKVAQDLLGKTLVCKGHHSTIIETEAYVGEDDLACHAARGRTPRTEVMYGPAGYSYIYLIYGMYHCLNITTEKEGFPAAVLIRGVQLLKQDKSLLLDGPGKLCRYFQLTREDNKIDMTTSNKLYVLDTNTSEKREILVTPRIGISRAQDKLWRFILPKKNFLS